MVKTILLIIFILLSFTSCNIFFQTPFPHELIYWKDSIPLDDLEPFEYTRLYFVQDSVFLFVQRKNDMNKLYYFSEDMKKHHNADMNFHCDTFAMKDMNSYYYIGSSRYEVNDLGISKKDEPVDSGTIGGEGPPYGHGFSHNSNNYYVRWNNDTHSLDYFRFNADWVMIESNSIILNDYTGIKRLYYHEDSKYPTGGMVVIFFEKEDNNTTNVVAAMIPAGNFESNLTDYYYHPMYLYNDSVFFPGIDAKYCYYTGDGFVIRDHDGTHYRFDMDGDLVKEIDLGGDNSGDEGITEAYSLDGKTRYIFSHRYIRLMKASVWW